MEYDQYIMMIEKATMSAINYVTDKILEEIKDQIVAQGIGIGGTEYEPTGEFVNAWKQNLANSVGGIITGSMEYDPMSMSINRDMFQHGSNVGGANDVREGLADIIFNGLSSDLFGDGFWMENRDAWTEMLAVVNQKFGKWVQEGFALQGIAGTLGYSVGSEGNF